MSQEKIYVGSGKQVTGTYGTFRSVSLCLSDIPAEHINEYKGKKYIKLNINDKKEADAYGKDVSISVDTWKPAAQATAPAEAVDVLDDIFG
jgi:hypothetical protein